MTAVAPDDAPFVGPRPFGAAESGVFFGRDREIEQLTSLVIAHPAVLLYAVSGAGKTSLLAAGLVPALEAQGFDVCQSLRLRPPEVPPADVANAFVWSALWRLGVDDDAGGYGQAPDPDATLPGALAALPRGEDRYGFPSPRLVIFDQFEELFTAHLDRWQEREGFFAQVGVALAEDPTLRVLFAMREEYLAPLDRYGALLPDGLRTRLHLERLRRAGALVAVTEPLRRAGVTIDDDVAETLVADLEQTRVDTGDGRMATVAGEFVEPVHLQVVCRTLWSRLGKGVERVTRADLAVLGSVDQSLTAYYESAMAAAVARAKGKDYRFREAFEGAFITSADTRATVFAGPDGSGPLPPAALDEFSDRHLIRGEWRAGGRWLELAHDRLIDPIRRSNGVVRERVRRRRLLAWAAGALCVAALIGGGAALFLRDATEPPATLTRYPGDDAPKSEVARWMATHAIAQGVPPELPIMAALVESNLQNIRFGQADSVGLFQMRTKIWNNGKYRGFPRDPQKQLQWFLDYAKAHRAREIKAGRPDPAESPRRYGEWIADVERPPEQYRARYQLRLNEARRLANRLVTAQTPGDSDATLMPPPTPEPAAAAPAAPAEPVP